TLTNDTTYTYYKYEINDIYNTIQSSLSKVKTKSNNWRDAKLFRLYFQDIEVPFFYWWGALRYVNKFSNGMFIASDVENYPELYQYYTMAPNRYFGMKMNLYEQFLSQPFFRWTRYNDTTFANPDYKILGYKYGFKGEHWGDTLTSGYETFFTNGSRNSYPTIFNDIKFYSEDDYNSHMISSNSVQTEWELVIKNKFNNPIHSNYLYLNSPWYVNLFIGTNYDLKEWLETPPLNNPLNKYVIANNVASKTAETIRLLMNTSLLMGAKGILYDREESNPVWSVNQDNDTIINTLFGLGDGNKPVFYNANKKYDFIENDSLGGDFTGGYSDIYDIWKYIVPDSVAKYAHISPDRIYIGTRSIRLEVKKIVDWIRLNDKELIDLRLQAMFSKGFKTFESWNPYKFSRWNSSPLRQLVNLEGIRTRKLFEPKHTMIHNTSPDYEFIDSSFFDITLLQHKNNTDTDILKNKNAVYLGVINRRTDPLIFRDSIEVGTLDSLRELMFFTAAEFDDKVRYGGVDLWGINQDSTWWQSQWWKRLGSREIKIPLNIEPYGNGTYILAQEIGLDSLDLLGWRYDEKYYHRVDTTLTYNDSLMTKLLPAQGKIIKLEFVPYFFNDPTTDSIPENDSCYFCDIYNDFDLFEFVVTANTGEEGGCCYDVELKYNGNCKFEDIPIRLLFEGETGNSFDDSGLPGTLIDSSGTNIKYKDFLFDFDSTITSIDLGTFCITDSTNKYTISLLAGKDKDGKFIGCDREMQFEVKCDSTETPPIDCCEGLAVSHTMYSTGTSELDPTLGSYCTKYNIDTGFDSDCIFGVTIEGGGVQRPLIPVGLTPLDFTAGSGIEFTLCYPMAQCGSESAQSQSIKMVKMQFLGKNGTVVCEIEVPILIPCIYYGVSDFTIDQTSPYVPKSSKEKTESKTYESDSFKVTIWPNPTSGELNVEIDSKVDTEVDINFINNIGASITNENSVTINKGVNEKTYNLKNYSSGIYYLQIQSNEGQIVLPIMLNK
ncbi:MAG: T9SS type A sorting domain-containing protein, partial [Ignavibacteriae bacterium]|nr:T9SS type A sorting domain-containing protein [Ignavibacteriota bacterium]